MDNFFPELQALAQQKQRKLRKQEANKLTLRTGEQQFRLWAFSQTGFALMNDEPLPAHGYADIYEGDFPRFRCLFVHAKDEDPLRYFEFKTLTAYRQSQPLDFDQSQEIAGYLAT